MLLSLMTKTSDIFAYFAELSGMFLPEIGGVCYLKQVQEASKTVNE